MRPDEFILNYRVTIAALYARGGAARWNIAEASFGEVLGRAVARRFANADDARDRASVVAFLESLHVEDLALAIACRAGNEAAWREFDAKFRSVIESIARVGRRDECCWDSTPAIRCFRSHGACLWRIVDFA
ncbi:MAG: hypothetical protein ACLQAT_13235 [Candidatus Binataceae bacterium]